MNRCTDMSQNIENMVESLTNLVNNAKGVLRSFGKGSEKNGTLSKPSCSVNYSLKKLYIPKHWKSCCECSLGLESYTKQVSKFIIPHFQKKFTETFKDSFLISDLSIKTVPRRNSGQFYYKNGLVAAVVQFDSSMDDEDVYKQIRERFCKYEDLQFEFLKAVYDNLVKPGVEKLDYKTMKHNWTRSSLCKMYKEASPL